MAWPSTPYITFVADSPPTINADFLNALQAAINGLVNGTILSDVTFKSVQVDGIGGNPVTIPAGDILTSVGNISATVGHVSTGTFMQAGSYVQAGAYVSGTEFFGSLNGAVAVSGAGTAFTSIVAGASGANPAYGVPIPNQYRAVNCPKAAGYVVTNGLGSVSTLDGFGIIDVQVVAAAGAQPAKLKVLFSTAFSDTLYQVVATCHGDPTIGGGGHNDILVANVSHLSGDKTITFCMLYAWDVGGTMPVDWSTTVGAGVYFEVFGRQAT